MLNRVNGMQVHYIDGVNVRSTSLVYYNDENGALYYKPVTNGVERLVQLDDEWGLRPYKTDFKHVW